MKHTPHPALIGSYNNGRDLHDMIVAARALKQQMHEQMEEQRKAQLWSLAHLKAFFKRNK